MDVALPIKSETMNFLPNGSVIIVLSGTEKVSCAFWWRSVVEDVDVDEFRQDPCTTKDRVVAPCCCCGSLPVIPSDRDDMDGLITAIVAEDEDWVPNQRDPVRSDLLTIVLILVLAEVLRLDRNDSDAMRFVKAFILIILLDVQLVFQLASAVVILLVLLLLE